MSSAKIIPFPRAARRRPAPVRYLPRSSFRPQAGGFTMLLFVTIPVAFLYLSGAAHVARHDALYTALLGAVWGFYFIHPLLLRTRIGPLLVCVGKLLVLAGIGSFFGFVYWIVLTHH